MQDAHRRRLRRTSRLVAAACAALVLGACTPDGPPPAAGDTTDTAEHRDTRTSTPDAADPTEDGFPISLGGIDIPSRPERVVSLSATATEMLFAIGAGDQVVAADEYSNHPAHAPTTALSGFQPNVEAISAFDPDLVVASSDPGELAASLAALGIPTLVLPSATSIDEAYAQIDALGVATGNTDAASDVIGRMHTDIAEIVAGLDAPVDGYTYYHELTPDFHSVSGRTFIGDAYRLLGLSSIADPVGEAGGPYPQLSPEFIISADPDIILLADGACCDVTPEVVRERPGWDTIGAVDRGAIVVLDEDIASRWGPRIVDLLRDVADVVRELEPVER